MAKQSDTKRVSVPLAVTLSVETRVDVELEGVDEGGEFDLADFLQGEHGAELLGKAAQAANADETHGEIFDLLLTLGHEIKKRGLASRVVINPLLGMCEDLEI